MIKMKLNYFPSFSLYFMMCIIVIDVKGNCDSSNCSSYSICVKDGKHGEEKCICQTDCGHDGPQVCGNDGKTYVNECDLHAYQCRTGRIVMQISSGPCDVCRNVHCHYGAECVSGSCVCPTDCPSDGHFICASDGHSYPNECLMRKASCEGSINLTIVETLGKCPLEVDKIVTESPSGVGYIRTCDPKTCRYGGTCDYDEHGTPRCSCSFSCPSEDGENEKVCGSDGRLYDNECKLQEEACRRQQDIQTQDRKMCEESRKLPCNGETHMALNVSYIESQFQCSNESTSSITLPRCPPNSYCDESPYFALCCRKLDAQPDCRTSDYGCCLDEVTIAPGPNRTGCPESCGCNRMGSYSITCHPVTNQCHCKHGVGGLQCDRCEPGFWGLHKTSEGNSGCIPCSCNMSGSVRNDCEQMTGRCVCKHGLQGIKCNVCPEGSTLGPDGCTHVALATLKDKLCLPGLSQCGYGATCINISATQSQCICDIDCNQTNHPSTSTIHVDNDDDFHLHPHPSSPLPNFHSTSQHSTASSDPDNLPILTHSPPSSFPSSSSSSSPTSPSSTTLAFHDPKVCGSDGNSYTSECALRLYACRMQKSIDIQYYGMCGYPISTSTTINSDLNVPDSLDKSSDISYPTSSTPTSRDDFEMTTSTTSTEGMENVTMGPIKRSTIIKTTLQDSDGGLTSSSAEAIGNDSELITASERPTTSSMDMTEKVISVPGFFGESSIEMARLQAYNRLSIEIEFSTLSDYGLLLYNGQTSSGEGDFISLSIRAGYVEFRYNLGSGTVILRSQSKIKLGQRTVVVAKRYLREGVLSVSSQQDITGKADGELKSLDLAEKLYLGRIWSEYSKVYENIGTRKGLMGCLYLLRIGRVKVNLTYPGSLDILKAIGIVDCADIPCTNTTTPSSAIQFQS